MNWIACDPAFSPNNHFGWVVGGHDFSRVLFDHDTNILGTAHQYSWGVGARKLLVYEGSKKQPRGWNLTTDVLFQYWKLLETLRNVIIAAQSMNMPIDTILVEQPGGSQSVRDALALRTALLACQTIQFHFELDLITITASATKKAVTGDRFSDKTAVMRAMEGMFPWFVDWAPKGKHKDKSKSEREAISDSLAVAVAILHFQKGLHINYDDWYA